MHRSDCKGPSLSLWHHCVSRSSLQHACWHQDIVPIPYVPFLTKCSGILQPIHVISTVHQMFLSHSICFYSPVKHATQPHTKQKTLAIAPTPQLVALSSKKPALLRAQFVNTTVVPSREHQPAIAATAECIDEHHDVHCDITKMNTLSLKNGLTMSMMYISMPQKIGMLHAQFR